MTPGSDDPAVPEMEFSGIDEIHDLGADFGGWVEDGTLLRRYWPLITDTRASIETIQDHVRHFFADSELMIPAPAMIVLVHARRYMHPAVCGAAVRNQWLGGGLDGPSEFVASIFRVGRASGGLMTRAELEVLDSLPDQITAYRGCIAGCESPTGMSWTLDLTIADHYTQCDGQPNGKILKGTFPKDAVLAYFAERDESELVVDARRVTITGSRTGASTHFPDKMASFRW